MTEPKQREKFKPTQEWADLTLVFDFDADHPKSHGESEYGAWTVRTVRDEKGVEYSFFASSNLIELLDHLEINKKGNRFLIRKQAELDSSGKAFAFFEIETANGIFNTKVGAVNPETGLPSTTTEEQMAEAIAKGLAAKSDQPMQDSSPHSPDAVDDALALIHRIAVGYVRELRRVTKELDLPEENWERFYDHKHITTIFLNLSR